MRIAIDVSQVVYGTGVSTYTKNLVSSLLSLDQKNEYVLFGGSFRRIGDLRRFYDTLAKYSFERKIFPLPPGFTNFLWNKLHIIPIEALVGKVDVFHSSDWAQPSSKAFKVTTIHDLIPLKFPQLSHPRIVSAHRHRFKWVKKEVDKIIAPSEVTKNDLIKLGIKKGRIEVIPEAPDPIFMPAVRKKIAKVMKKYRIRGKFLLAVGITPRKNTKRIIQAFKKVQKLINLNLVIIGYPHINIEAGKHIILPGVVAQEDLPALYSGAEALLYPSLYEGYGLPILESFATETPVVTSNLGSLKEVAKDAAVLVNPESVKSIKEGILASLEKKHELVTKGVKRVKIFSWQKSAKETLRIYETVRK